MTSRVTLPPAVRGIVLDIEGTTTPIAFVHKTLFSYAREHLAELLREPLRDDVRDGLFALCQEWRMDSAADATTPECPPTGGADALRYLNWLIDRDRKSPALKALQGLVWQKGYEDGTLCSEVYDDVPRALQRWKNAGLQLAIYSSGSVLAQRTLFAHTTHGDLTPFLDRYFDTAVGAKRSADSYRAITQAMGCGAGQLLFISDIAEELDAAKAAGLETLLCVRGGDAESLREDPRAIDSFDEIGDQGTQR